MLLLGHVGITFGTALAAESLAQRCSERSEPVRGHCLSRWHATLTSLARRLDLRLLLIGSLLPDIIDKPVGLILFPSALGSGRIYSHTLFFLLLLSVPGYWLYRRGNGPDVLTLAFGSAIHLLLDAMWRTPAILFWPLFGPMPRGGTSGDWLAQLLHTLLTNPAAYWTEIAGAILLAPLAWVILRSGGLARFLRSGEVS